MAKSRTRFKLDRHLGGVMKEIRAWAMREIRKKYENRATRRERLAYLAKQQLAIAEEHVAIAQLLMNSAMKHEK
jgi:hypothetical protein